MKQPQFEGLTFRQNYLSDPSRWQALVDLLQDTFHIDLSVLDRLGGMDPSSMPFGWFDEIGILAANFSAFSMPMMIDGEERRVAALQSGAVQPQWRGKGLYRDLMRRAFKWVDAERFELAILYTDKPDLYQPYGFSAVPVHKFIGPAPKCEPASPTRALSMDAPEDVKLLAMLIKNRTHASHQSAPLSHPAMFLVNAFWDRTIALTHLEDHDAVVAWRSGEVLQLLDVVGESIPSLAAITGALGTGAADVECFFVPDRLNWSGQAVIDDNRLTFMVRGDLSLLPQSPFALTPMADF
jgi:GNAT superfamily N-acetyltransferase